MVLASHGSFPPLAVVVVDGCPRSSWRFKSALAIPSPDPDFFILPAIPAGLNNPLVVGYVGSQRHHA